MGKEKQKDAVVSLLVAKTITLRAAGLTEEQCLSIKEYEFAFVGGEVKYLETWSNTKRTKGNKKYPVTKVVGQMLLDAFVY